MFAQRIDRLARHTMNELDAALALQQTGAGASQDAYTDAIVIAVARIQHHDRTTFGFQHAMNFADRADDVERVMQHTMRINKFERSIGEIKIHSVGNLKFTLKATLLKILSSYIHTRFR